MKFVEKYLNRHHFFNSPHKWFFSFLSSPIHFAELHYKKKYHLSFVHAKKLFFFDMVLLCTVLVLSSLTIFWFSYDPTVLGDIGLNISSPQSRIASGEHVDFAINFENTSGSLLVDSSIALLLPESFILDISSLSKNYPFSNTSKSFSVGDLHPGANGKITLSGWFYGEPEIQERITARLSYLQEKRDVREFKDATILQTPRGSLIKASINMPDSILSSGEIDFNINLSGEITDQIDSISLNISNSNFKLSSHSKPSQGLVEKGVWIIPINEGQTSINAKMSGKLSYSVVNNQQTSTYTVTPKIVLQNKPFLQVPVTKSLGVVNPKMSLSGLWISGQTAHPGDITKLKIKVQNTGHIKLVDGSISFDVPDQVDVVKLIDNNVGLYSNQTYTVTAGHNAGLKSIGPGEIKEVILEIPIKNNILEGENIEIKIDPKLEAQIPSMSGTKYNTQSSIPEVRVSTDLALGGSLMYYTGDGEQIGRGPLPPQVGKQTTYWATISVKNTTNKLEYLQFIAELSDRAIWLDKSSVSHGKTLHYDSKTHSVTWSLPEMSTHDIAGIYMGIGYIPTPEDIGNTPVLIKHIATRGVDTFVDENIKKTLSSIDISLKGDQKAQKRGVAVQ